MKPAPTGLHPAPAELRLPRRNENPSIDGRVEKIQQRRLEMPPPQYGSIVRDRA
jgi:hypothetical protein